MGRIISIHEYDLKPGLTSSSLSKPCATLKHGVAPAPRARGSLFCQRGERCPPRAYAALWIYESREAWERLWAARAARGPQD